jgi:hypothetical protein
MKLMMMMLDDDERMMMLKKGKPESIFNVGKEMEKVNGTDVEVEPQSYFLLSCSQKMDAFLIGSSVHINI